MCVRPEDVAGGVDGVCRDAVEGGEHIGEEDLAELELAKGRDDDVEHDPPHGLAVLPRRHLHHTHTQARRDVNQYKRWTILLG